MIFKKLFINFDRAGPWLQHVASLLGRLLLLQCADSLVWDLSSPTRDQTHAPCTGRGILNHWTIGQFSPLWSFYVHMAQMYLTRWYFIPFLLRGDLLVMNRTEVLVGSFRD